ncbi:hypothetical protein AX14_006710 [Amanita brunnescens Koide BX004]|nr:hypothetical protein AX14_006710 [Amanita brunnescens Koide BX004]
MGAMQRARILPQPIPTIPRQLGISWVELVAQEGRKEVTEEMVEASLYISDHIRNVASSSCMVMTMFSKYLCLFVTKLLRMGVGRPHSLFVKSWRDDSGSVNSNDVL